MAETSEEETSSEEYSPPEEDPDEQYDPTSEKYNALRALYFPHRAIPLLPWSKAPAMDNLAKYSLAARGKTLHKVVTKGRGQSSDMPSTSSEIQRRFLPHQEPTKGRGKAVKNVITRMESIEGPLAVLRDAMERSVRVKVVIRGVAGWGGRDRKRPKGRPQLDTRGELHGSICAFDRHWNLAMEDVTEVFRRRAPKFSKTLPCVADHQVRWPRGYKPLPRVTVLSKEHRYEVCERYLGQVMVRGEQVALVAIS
ncbi:U7 snRNA-associated Sm-like protein LSm11 [Ischnura elegans]|uniref:U7 snRNA-associated Sm-like protein LSm11 n=1 Tax=Ischnura elegans TaxID=197161 RepID=UPI001ED86BA8|nr:U7 snRNA-associated Sm-like protein LSm11 [Ischnura elegans]